MAMGDAEHSLVWEEFLSPVVNFDETMVKLIVGFDGNEGPPPYTLRTRGGGSGSESDDDNSIKRGMAADDGDNDIPVDVPLPPSDFPPPFCSEDQI